jgi:membrane-associated protease RseP (regulator of RpoE activity)
MGGFILQRYWVVPVAMIIMLNNPAIAASQYSVPMPDWWPMVKSSIPAEVLMNAMLMIVPFYGLMGFNSITFTMDRKRKAAETGIFKMVYSLTLFGLARLAVSNPMVEAALPLLALSIHEGWVYFDRKRELTGKPKYMSGDEGVMVLEVIPESIAAEMGIRSGDLLLSINDIRIENENMLMETLRQGTSFIWLGIKRENGSLDQISYDKMFQGKQLGLLLVPKGMPEDSMVIKFDDSAIKRTLDKINKRENDR